MLETHNTLQDVNIKKFQPIYEVVRDLLQNNPNLTKLAVIDKVSFLTHNDLVTLFANNKHKLTSLTLHPSLKNDETMRCIQEACSQLKTIHFSV